MILLLIALLAAPEGASQVTPVGAIEAPPAPAKAKPLRGDRVVCKRGVNNTGSHIRPRSVCMMKRDWDKQERLDSEAIRAVQNNSNLGNKVPGSDGT